MKNLCALMALLTALVVLALAVPSTAGDYSDWVLLSTDPDEGSGVNIKALYYKVVDDVIYFRVEYYRNFTSVMDLDTGIFIDVDCNESTGVNVDAKYPQASTGLGAEYVIVIGYEAVDLTGNISCAVRATDSDWNLSNPILPVYTYVPIPGNVAIVGYRISDLSGLCGVAKLAAAEVQSSWDWCPDSGNVTIIAALTVGGELDIGPDMLQQLSSVDLRAALLAGLIAVAGAGAFVARHYY